jgi:hypothetical protein
MSLSPEERGNAYERRLIASRACVMGGTHEPRDWTGAPAGCACRKCHKTWFYRPEPHQFLWPYVPGARSAEAIVAEMQDRMSILFGSGGSRTP